MAANSSAGVYLTELDQSQVISSTATTIAAFTAYATQGPLGPTLITSTSGLSQYGSPNLAVTPLHYIARDYLKVGNQIYINRVVGSGALYGGALIQKPASTFTITAYGGLATPSTIDFNTAGGATGANQNLVFVYGIGPGAYYNNIEISIISNNLSPPTGLTATPNATGGTLAASTYSYEVTAVGINGETLPSTVAPATTTGSTGSVSLSWSAVTNAVGYRVYGRTSSNYLFLASTNSATTTFIDTGSITPAGAAPITAPAATTGFQLLVYDTSQSTTVPVETWNVTLDNELNQYNQSTEIATVLNTSSQYVNALSNVPNWTVTLPTVSSVTATQFTGGANGTAPTDAQIITGIQAFNNTDQIKINLLINGGYSTPDIQQAMDTVAHNRADTICILDMPPQYQNVQDAVNFRNINLNLNSNRSAIFSSDLQYVDFVTGQQIFLPPSGAVAARVAYTDFVANPGYSIAGMNRGVIPDAIGVRVPYNNLGDRNALASSQINYFRSFVGQGIVLWEQRTLQASLSALSFISVRRIFDIIEQSIVKALQFSLQEPNDPFTVTQIVNLINQFLKSLVLSQAIAAGNVVSNSTNNPPQLTGQGILNVTVFITPNLPVNQIQLLAILTQQGVQFVENPGGIG